MPRNRRLTTSVLAKLGQQAGLQTIRVRAELLGISFGYLADIERGSSLPTPEIRERMAKAYNCPLEYIARAVKMDRQAFASRITEHANDL